MNTLVQARLLGLAAAALCVAGCFAQEDIDPMTQQAKYKAFAPNPFFADGRSMRVPPANTVSRERPISSSQLEYGLDEKGTQIDKSPVALTPALMATGHKQYDIHCAVCHGVAGDGKSLVATQMSLKSPPNLIEKKGLSDGHIFNAITSGYGLMGGYAADLTNEERWAVVAYLRALQRSQSTTLADAPAEVRSQLEKEQP